MKIKGFEQLYAEENTWLNRGRKELVMGILRREIGGPGKDLLDVGAGSGFHIPALATYGEVDAVEVCEPAVLALRHRGGLRNLYTESMPFPLEHRYDYVQCLDVLGAIKDDLRAMNWLCSLLKPGGTLFVTVPAYQWLFSFHDVAVNHLRRYSRTSLTDLVPKGFSVLQSGYFNTSLFPLAVATRLLAATMRRLKPGSAEDLKQSSHLSPSLDRLFGAIIVREAARIIAGAEPVVGLAAFCLLRRPNGTAYARVIPKQLATGPHDRHLAAHAAAASLDSMHRHQSFDRGKDAFLIEQPCA
jgi:SAM-dependent methyltransferase